jgi:antitoxin ParD1/3/4
MTTTISPELEHLVRSLVATGQYQDEHEVLAEALELLRRRDVLRAEIQVGLDELDRGEGVPAREVFDELRQRLATLNQRTA